VAQESNNSPPENPGQTRTSRNPGAVHWTFWLILVAFLAGVLRVPVAILQLTGVLHATTPAWYVGFQVLIGLAQTAIGLAMLAAYRRSGVWGAVPKGSS
jgi:cytochrome c biogenesis protein CcdA